MISANRLEKWVYNINNGISNYNDRKNAIKRVVVGDNKGSIGIIFISTLSYLW